MSKKKHTDFGEVFEDIMSYMEKKLGREEFKNDADLRDYIQRGDAEGKISGGVMRRMQETQEWKDKITRVEKEEHGESDYEVVRGNQTRFDSKVKRYRDKKGRFTRGVKR